MSSVAEHNDSKPRSAHFSAPASRRWELASRWSAGTVFLVFGVGKFVNHSSELASFRHYGLPLSEFFVYAIGVLEIVGGLLLASRFLLRWAAAALAIDMVGAFLVSGIGQGEVISLTLAPALLIVMAFLLRGVGVKPPPPGSSVPPKPGVA